MYIDDKSTYMYTCAYVDSNYIIPKLFKVSLSGIPFALTNTKDMCAIANEICICVIVLQTGVCVCACNFKFVQVTLFNNR